MEKENKLRATADALRKKNYEMTKENSVKRIYKHKIEGKRICDRCHKLKYCDKFKNQTMTEWSHNWKYICKSCAKAIMKLNCEPEGVQEG